MTIFNCKTHGKGIAGSACIHIALAMDKSKKIEKIVTLSFEYFSDIDDPFVDYYICDECARLNNIEGDNIVISFKMLEEAENSNLPPPYHEAILKLQPICMKCFDELVLKLD
jgi:hypothetical protein